VPVYSKYPIFIQNRTKQWFIDLIIFMENRYKAIVDRFIQSNRYLDFDPRNYRAFSYEYASLIRDIGSCFSSSLDHLLKKSCIKPVRGNNYTVFDFSRYLNEYIDDIQKIGVILNYDFNEKYVYPFQGFESDKVNSVWWDAYNDLKHNELYSKTSGCLSNFVYSFSALTILLDAVTKRGAVEGSNREFLILTRGLVSSLNSDWLPLDEYQFPKAT